MQTLAQMTWFSKSDKYGFYFNAYFNNVPMCKRYKDIMPLFKVYVNG